MDESCCNLAPHFNSFTTHILLKNDRNEAPFVASYLKMLRFCLRNCLRNVCFGHIAFFGYIVSLEAMYHSIEKGYTFDFTIQ